MRSKISREKFKQRLTEVHADPVQIKEMLLDQIDGFPDQLNQWILRLKLMYGVPFNYLVPDEKMLLPESIRFFYVDTNWMDALVDGAFSIGRNLDASTISTDRNIDGAVIPELHKKINVKAGSIRGNLLGQKTKEASLAIVSGFLMRSSLIAAYPALGVYGYNAAGNLLDILRLEKLGDQSDTLICLFDGDAAEVQVHEAPEHLHFGIDSIQTNAKGTTAMKKLYKFTKNGNDVSIDPTPLPCDISPYFRKNSPRTLQVNLLAGYIQQQISTPNFDSAQMGFEMTEGVGLVSFNVNAGNNKI